MHTKINIAIIHSNKNVIFSEQPVYKLSFNYVNMFTIKHGITKFLKLVGEHMTHTQVKLKDYNKT